MALVGAVLRQAVDDRVYTDALREEGTVQAIIRLEESEDGNALLGVDSAKVGDTGEGRLCQVGHLNVEAHALRVHRIGDDLRQAKGGWKTNIRRDIHLKGQR